MKLSVIIITKNEAAHIQDCIQSVAFADEVVVLDSGSTDETCALAQAAGARVYQSPDWPGFGPQKNRALDHARGEWVLSLDADERVSRRLADEIKGLMAKSQQPHEAYAISRLSAYGGRWMRHSGWHPDYLLRLFKRGKARFSNDLVHERVVYRGQPGRLQGLIYHYPYESPQAHIEKMNRYAEAAAQGLQSRGKTISVLGIAGKMWWTFFRVYVLRRGFLDGPQGFLLAMMAASGNMFRYSKLWFLNQQIDWQPPIPQNDRPTELPVIDPSSAQGEQSDKPAKPKTTEGYEKHEKPEECAESQKSQKLEEKKHINSE